VKVAYRPDGRPSLVCSLSLSRVRRPGPLLSSSRAQQHRMQQLGSRAGRDKKAGGKELWFTRSSGSSLAAGLSSEVGGNSARKAALNPSEPAHQQEYPTSGNRIPLGDHRTSREESVMNSERLASPLPPDRPLSRSAGAGWDTARPHSLRERHDSGGSSSRSGYKSSSSSSHRKHVERTLSPLDRAELSGVVGCSESFTCQSVGNEDESGGYDRKRGRIISPVVGASAGNKRLRPESDEEEDEQEEVLGSRRAQFTSSLAHPTFLPATPELGGLMPPPASTVPVYYSYFER
jgi:hypothetical protein